MTELAQIKEHLELIVKVASTHRDSDVLSNIELDASLALTALEAYTKQQQQLLEDDVVQRIVEGVANELTTQIDEMLGSLCTVNDFNPESMSSSMADSILAAVGGHSGDES